MNTKKILIFLLLIVSVSILLYFLIFKSNTIDFNKKRYLFIKTGSNYQDVIKAIEDSAFLKDFNSFKKMSSWMNLSKSIHPGRYEIKKNMSNYKLINTLKKGNQTVVKLVINKLRTKNDIASKLSSYLECDESKWQKLFSDSTFLKNNNIDSNQIQALVMPDTYEFYWNVSPEKVFERFLKVNKRFWNEDRIAHAKNKNLSRMDIIILASIVDEETNKHDEKPMIASVYLNRLKMFMPLGADPTVKYAVGDFTLKRILTAHTEINSPYNTYKNVGLPPGPICTPSAKSIDAVLNPTTSEYLYFCAKEDFSGYHNFAITYSEHLMNAKKYQTALTEYLKKKKSNK